MPPPVSKIQPSLAARRPARARAGEPSRLTWTPPGTAMQHPVVSSEWFRTNQKEADMESTTVAVDLARSVFEVAVANERGQISERKRFGRTAFMRFLTKRPPCRVVMEACGTAHYWGRVAQEHGHQVTLLPSFRTLPVCLGRPSVFPPGHFDAVGPWGSTSSHSRRPSASGRRPFHSVLSLSAGAVRVVRSRTKNPNNDGGNMDVCAVRPPFSSWYTPRCLRVPFSLPCALPRSGPETGHHQIAT